MVRALICDAVSRSRDEKPLPNFHASDRLHSPHSDYSCAISKTILTHGRIYISKNFVCFYSNIFGHETSERIRVADIVECRPSRTALVIPNAIEVVTTGAPAEPFVFASFYSRDEVLALLRSILPAPASAAAAATHTTPTPAAASSTPASPTAAVSGASASKSAPATPTASALPAADIDISVAAVTGTDLNVPEALAALTGAFRTALARLAYVDRLPLDPSPPEPALKTDMEDADMEQIICVDVAGITPRILHRLCYGADAILPAHDFHAACEDTEIQISRWARPIGGALMSAATPAVVETDMASVQLPQRTFIFRSLIKDGPMGPPSTRVHKRQCAQWFASAHAATAKDTRALKPTSFSSQHSPQHPHLLVMDSFVSVDAPYGDHFSLHDRIEVLALPPADNGTTPVTRIRICIAARFCKWTMLKCAARSETTNGLAACCAF
jgi:hypothetical protein